MRIILAPMEGVADASMRRLLTNQGGFDLCISEFIRIVDMKLPKRVFYRICPELDNDCQTESGTPVRIQLLGQEPNWMAENADRAIRLGSHGIDINFGCPSRTVNKNKGGASLLREPETIYQIVKKVRETVPAYQTVSAKMRLGWDCKSQCVEIAQAIEAAGANELTVHARTKEEGYKPPAHWQYIKLIKDSTNLNIIANGEVWNKDDYLRCQAISGCDDIMIGRGAVTIPNLAQHIKGAAIMPWADVKQLMIDYGGFETIGDREKYFPQRLKQWFKYITKQYPESHALFNQIRSIKDTELIMEALTQ
ncbi:tRNA-dihydrouridine synthase [Psychromonas sp. MME2]|uniref:tRNA-dihydrouridine synthase n=1 Tax=unclassified Psychromonas TaxID=2614957 RepID=UPI00339C6CAF